MNILPPTKLHHFLEGKVKLCFDFDLEDLGKLRYKTFDINCHICIYKA